MTTSLFHLPDREQRNLRSITQHIVQAINPEWLFCYGRRTEFSYWQTCYLYQGPSCRYKHQYELVMIVKQQEKQRDEELQLLAKAAAVFCEDVEAVDVQVHRKEDVLSKLREKDFFFSTLFCNGTLLHSPFLPVHLP